MTTIEYPKVDQRSTEIAVNRRRKQRGRDINGVLLLDKPAGITSNDALQKVKRLFDARKLGHTGSLDKPATGMLPLCFGEATKFTSYLLNADKRYIARCRLGQETTTADADGEITASHEVPALSAAMVESVLNEFRGGIEQVPPMHSALKHKGERLYKLAYQGIEVEREARPVTIFELVCLEIGDTELLLEVHCSKGTYVRTLVEDIGRRLGCGAHILSLVRTAVSVFTGEQMISIATLEQLAEEGSERLDSMLMPVDSVIIGMPSITLASTVSCYLEKGQAVIVPHAPTHGMLRIYNENNDFIGVGEVLDDGRIAPRRLVNQLAG